MDYPYIRGEEIPDYAKGDSCDPLHEYIDSHIQILIDEYLGGVVQAISIFQSQCVNMDFADQSRYNRIFQRVVQKRVYLEINYIKRLHNAKALSISVGNIFTE